MSKREFYFITMDLPDPVYHCTVTHEKYVDIRWYTEGKWEEGSPGYHCVYEVDKWVCEGDWQVLRPDQVDLMFL
jgi:hypothetical protein